VLVALFCALLVISNIAAVKLFGPDTVMVAGHEWDMTFDGGAFLFPLTYIIGDVLAEVFGFRAARRAIITGFACSALASGVFWLVQVMPPAANWEGQEAFEQTLGVVWRMVVASLAGYLGGQLLNAWFMGLIKRATNGKALWVRLLGSTAVGEAADTILFCTIAFYGVITGGQFLGYLVLGYIYKCLVEVVLLPVTYRVVAWVRRREGLA
jgi:uncharacterized integral membrane protein (TIGR00697 family)